MFCFSSTNCWQNYVIDVTSLAINIVCVHCVTVSLYLSLDWYRPQLLLRNVIYVPTTKTAWQHTNTQLQSMHLSMCIRTLIPDEVCVLQNMSQIASSQRSKEGRLVRKKGVKYIIVVQIEDNSNDATTNTTTPHMCLWHGFCAQLNNYSGTLLILLQLILPNNMSLPVCVYISAYNNSANA